MFGIAVAIANVRVDALPAECRVKTPLKAPLKGSFTALKRGNTNQGKPGGRNCTIHWAITKSGGGAAAEPGVDPNVSTID